MTLQRQFKPGRVEWRGRKYYVEIEAQEEDTPPEGNASAIDPKTDAEVLEWIYDQLASGNEWAWCTVCVTVTDEETGDMEVDYLGNCSYKSEEDFVNSHGIVVRNGKRIKTRGYFGDMVMDCIERLRTFK